MLYSKNGFNFLPQDYRGYINNKKGYLNRFDIQAKT
ncbi:hypothetical protein BH11BAC5_BH11BAC5_54870 [soil metagenome]|jgi:hypothetical protein